MTTVIPRERQVARQDQHVCRTLRCFARAVGCSALLMAVHFISDAAHAEAVDPFKRAPVQPPLGRAVADTAPSRHYSATLSGPRASIANTIFELGSGGTPPVLAVVLDPEGARKLPTLIDPSAYQPPNDHPIPVESCDRVPVRLTVFVTLGAGSPYSKYAPPGYFLHATVGSQTVDGGSMPFREPGVPQWLPMREPVLLGPGQHTVDFRLTWNPPPQALPLPDVTLRSRFEIRCRQEAPSRQLASKVNPIGVFVGTTQVNAGSGNAPPPTGAANPAAGTPPNWGALPGANGASSPMAAATGARPPREALPARRGAGRLTFETARLGTIAYEQVDLEPAEGRLRATRRSDREVALLQQMAANGAVETVVRVAFADGEYELSQVRVSAVRPNPAAGGEPAGYAIDLKFAGVRRLR
jgi:hypothetical protein